MQFSELVGKTLSSVEVRDNERIVFTDSNGTGYSSYHMQDCCESVIIHDTVGDIGSIIGSPILEAEETATATISRRSMPIVGRGRASASRRPTAKLRSYGSANRTAITARLRISA